MNKVEKITSTTEGNLVLTAKWSEAMPVTSFENLFLSAVTTANVTVYDRGSVDSELKGMGTTIVAALVKNNEACIAHVGDSRAYKISGNVIEQITKDHSLVQEMIDSGQISKSESENAPIKNIITRALGINEEIDIDFDFVCINENELITRAQNGDIYARNQIIELNIPLRRKTLYNHLF